MGFGAAVASAAWAVVAEIMPVYVKAIVGTLLGVAAAGGAGKAWLNKRNERNAKEKDEDQ